MIKWWRSRQERRLQRDIGTVSAALKRKHVMTVIPLMKYTKLGSARVSLALARMERAGQVESFKSELDPYGRRFYRLTRGAESWHGWAEFEDLFRSAFGGERSSG